MKRIGNMGEQVMMKRDFWSQNKMMQRFMLMAMLLLGLSVAQVNAEEAMAENSLEAIDVSSLPGNRVHRMCGVAHQSDPFCNKLIGQGQPQRIGKP